MSDCFDCCLFSFLAGAVVMGLFVIATIVLDIGMDWIETIVNMKINHKGVI